MATTDQPTHAEQDEEEFIEQDDVFAEIDQGDEPMDEDDDAGGVEGEVVWEDNSIQHFSGHEGPVYTVSAHPTTTLAVSGGGDDAGYIWDVTDGEIIVKLTGHTDSVSAVGFSSDGEMVSTGGMDGKVRVWRRVGKEDYKTWEFLTELQGPDEVIVRTPTVLCLACMETNRCDSVCSGCVGTPKGQSCSLALMTVQSGYGSVSTYHSASAKVERLKVSSQCHPVIPCKYSPATRGLSSAESLRQTVSKKEPVISYSRGTKTISRQTHRNRVRRQYLHLLGPALADPTFQANRNRRPVQPGRHHLARRKPRFDHRRRRRRRRRRPRRQPEQGRGHLGLGRPHGRRERRSRCFCQHCR